MKKFTKILALLLAVLMILSLVACGEDDSPRKRRKSDDNDDTVPVATTPDEPSSTESEPLVTEPEPTEPEPTEPEPTEPDVTLSGDIVGNWKTSLDLNAIIEAAAASSEDEDAKEQMEMFKAFFDGIDGIGMNLSFQADGTYSVAVDPDSAETIAEAIKTNIVTMLPALMGVSEEELDEYLSSSGMTREQFAELVSSQINTDDMIESMSGAGSNGTYRCEGNKVWMTGEDEEEDPDNYWIVEISGDEMRVTDIVGGDEEDGSAAIKEEMLPLVFHRAG